MGGVPEIIHNGWMVYIILYIIYHLVMTFTVRHGKKITMFKFGKHLFRLGASKNHGELLVITRGYHSQIKKASHSWMVPLIP